MKTVHNANCTLMRKNTPVLKFNLVGGYLEEFEVIDESLLPFDFKLNKFKEDALMVFLQYRVVPETRIGINEEVKKIGLKYYDPDKLFHFMHGRSIEDDYWFKFVDDDDSLTYEKLVEELDKVGR